MARPYDFNDDYLRWLIYGVPGSGKTWMAASAVKDKRLCNVLMLEAKGNPISLRGWKQKPDIISIRQMVDFNGIYEFLASGQPNNHPLVKDWGLHPPYYTLVIDGLTEVQRFVIRRVTNTDFTNPGDITPDLGRQGFGKLLGTMLNWANCFWELPMHVIITCLEAKDGTTQYVHPLLWGQSGDELAGYAYTVMRITTADAAPKQFVTADSDPITADTVTFGTFTQTFQYFSKDQSGLGIDHMTNPDFTKVLNLLERSK